MSHKSQLQEIDKNIADLKARIDETNAMLKEYQSKIEETPKRVRELVILKRDYDNLNKAYNSLLGRKLEAEKSIEAEKKLRAEIGRELQEKASQGVRDFLSAEVKGLEIQLKQKEEEIKKYMEKYIGSLPEQFQTNINILERLQAQLLQDNSNLEGLTSLKNKLTNLQSRYSENHPEVIRLKEFIAEIIASLEKEREQASKQMEEPLDE